MLWHDALSIYLEDKYGRAMGYILWIPSLKKVLAFAFHIVVNINANPVTARKLYLEANI